MPPKTCPPRGTALVPTAPILPELGGDGALCHKALLSEARRPHRSRQPPLSSPAPLRGTGWGWRDLGRACGNTTALALSQRKPGTLGTRPLPPGAGSTLGLALGPQPPGVGSRTDWHSSLSCKRQDLQVTKAPNPQQAQGHQQKGPAPGACTDTGVEDSSLPLGHGLQQWEKPPSTHRRLRGGSSAWVLEN